MSKDKKNWRLRISRTFNLECLLLYEFILSKTKKILINKTKLFHIAIYEGKLYYIKINFKKVSKY